VRDVEPSYDTVMRGIATLTGRCAVEALMPRLSVFFHSFNALERLPKLATSSLGDRLKRQRLRLGLTQDELARRANIRRPTIVELETHRRVTVSSEVLKRLARALGCTTDYLVGMHEDDEDEASALVAAG